MFSSLVGEHGPRRFSTGWAWNEDRAAAAAKEEEQDEQQGDGGDEGEEEDKVSQW